MEDSYYSVHRNRYYVFNICIEIDITLYIYMYICIYIYI